VKLRKVLTVSPVVILIAAMLASLILIIPGQPCVFGVNNIFAITFTNSNGATTPVNFQQMIRFNPSNTSWNALERSDLGNLRFFADVLHTLPLYAWLENFTAITDHNDIIWVNLGSHTIAGAGGTLTIYVEFISTSTSFDVNYWGEAPKLSSPYGLHDNGPKVFSTYNNFNGSSLPSSWSSYLAGSGAGIVINNGVNLTTSSSAGDSIIQTNLVVTGAKVFDAWFQYAPYTVSSKDNDWFWGLTTTKETGTGGSVSANYMAAYTSTNNHYGIAGLSFASANPIVPGVMTVMWPKTGVESMGTVAQSGVDSGSYHFRINATSSATAYSNPYLEVAAGTAFNPTTIELYWVRTRAYPPDGVMPSQHFGGSFTSTCNNTTTSQTGTLTIILTGLNFPSGTTLGNATLPIVLPLFMGALFVAIPFALKRKGDFIVTALLFGVLMGGVLGTLGSAGSTNGFIPFGFTVVAGILLILWLWQGSTGEVGIGEVFSEGEGG
jgi:hypothetical protein